MSKVSFPTIAPRDRVILALLWASLTLLLACSIQLGGDEAYLRWVAIFGFWMNATLYTLAALCFAAFGMYNFKKGIVIHHTFVFGSDGPALPSGIDLHPDIAVFSLSPEESAEQLADRWEKAQSEAMGRFAILIGFRRPVAVIYGRQNGFEKTYTFTRDEPPHQGEDWPVKITVPGARFHAETWSQYQQYLSVFCKHFPEWSETEKVLSAPEGNTAATKVLRSFARSVSVLLFCFLSVSAFCQKSVRVEKYLGSERYNSAPESGTVKFIFQAAVIPRKSDGRKTYKQLLPEGPMWTDSDNAGKLQHIMVEKRNGGVMRIQPEDAPIESTHASVPDAPVSALPTEGNGVLMDSATAAAFAERTKSEIMKTTNSIRAGMTPIWNLFMWVFSKLLLPVLIGVAGFLFYISKTAAGESAVDLQGVPIIGGILVSAHQWAAGLMMIVLWILSFVMLVNAYLWLIYFDMPIWVILIAWAIILTISVWLTNWIVPNMRVANNQTQTGNYPLRR
jgi:hypothetical protein